MNCSSFTRRNQAALFAEMPAQGNDEGSVIVTFTVLPISKSAILPSESHSLGALRKSGAMTKPTSGTPRSSGAKATESNRDLLKETTAGISSGEGGSAPDFDSLGTVSFTANFADPSGERGNEKTGAHRENDP